METWEKLNIFSNYLECHYNDHRMLFQCFWLLHPIFMFRLIHVNVRNESKRKSALFIAKKQGLGANKISLEQFWFRAHFLDFLWMSVAHNIKKISALIRTYYSCFLNQSWTVLKKVKSLKQRLFSNEHLWDVNSRRKKIIHLRSHECVLNSHRCSQWTKNHLHIGNFTTSLSTSDYNCLWI